MTPEEREKFEGAYKRAKTVLTRLHAYAERELTNKATAMDSPQAFENANWSHLVAWWGGYRAAMRIMSELTRTK